MLDTWAHGMARATSFLVFIWHMIQCLGELAAAGAGAQWDAGWAVGSTLFRGGDEPDAWRTAGARPCM